MRERSYRAYDTVNNHMHYGGFSIHARGKVLRTPFIKCSISELVIEEFTGLKDKNGKKIYEGDLVSAVVTEHCIDGEKGSYLKMVIKEEYDPRDLIQKQVKKKWSVEYSSFMTFEGFRFYGENRRFNIKVTSSVISNNQIEVIGNIHESKEG